MVSSDKTVNSIVQFFEKLITEFSWPRLLFVAGLLITVVLALIVYEKVTGNFELTRLDREAAILERVLALQESAQDINDEDILASLNNLKLQLRGFMQPLPKGEMSSLNTETLLYAIMPWSLVGIFLLISSGRSFDSFVGLGVIATPVILLSVALPNFEPQWINHFLIPWGGCLIVVVLMVIWQRSKADKDS